MAEDEEAPAKATTSWDHEFGYMGSAYFKHKNWLEYLQEVKRRVDEGSVLEGKPPNAPKAVTEPSAEEVVSIVPPRHKRERLEEVSRGFRERDRASLEELTDEQWAALRDDVLERNPNA